MSPECSVVVPLHNQEAALPTLHLRLTATLRRLAMPYELIYVDDGSTDETASVIRDLQRHDQTVRGIFLTRRFGLRAAMCAGIEAAEGRAVITLDGDLEDPPELIPRLIDKWQEGNQFVAVRRKCRGWTALADLPFRLGGGLLGRLSEVPIGGDTGDSALMDRQVVDQFNALPERTRLLRGLPRWIGFRHAGIASDHEPRRPRRRAGWLGDRIGRGWEEVLAFSTAPLKAVSACGILLVTAGCASLARALFGDDGPPAERIPAAWFAGLGLTLGGLQLLAAGLVGAYVVRIFREVRGQPAWFVRERLGFSHLPRPVPDVLEFLPSETASEQERATRRRTGELWCESTVIQLKP